MTPDENRIFYRRMFELALPIGLQHLMLASVAAADAMMLGRVAQAEMTAVSMATQIQFIQNVFLYAVTTAGAILGAQYYGKGDCETLRDLFHLMLRYGGLVSIIFFISCEFFPGILMHFFTSDPELVRIGIDYLRIAGWSYLMTGISQCYLMIMKVTDYVKECAAISSGAVLLNIIFNAFLIFGLLGLPAMGARGAALATTLARMLELLVCLLIFTGKDYIRPVWTRIFSGSRALTMDFARQALPLLGGNLMWGVGLTSYTAIIGHVGSDAAAANAVSSVVRDLVCCGCNGIGTAAGIMVGNELGAGKLDLGKRYGIKLRNVGWIIGLGSTALVLAVTPFVVRFVIRTDEARACLTGMMVIMAVYMIGRSVNTVTINGVLDGGGDTIFDMYSLAVSMWCIAIPLAFVGAFFFKWPVLFVYACTCLDEVGKIPWVMRRFNKFYWVQDLTRERE